MVVVYWVIGNILQALLASAMVNAGLFDADNAFRAGLIAGWGILFVLSYIVRERLDAWLRA
jgi:hypothetical protein